MQILTDYEFRTFQRKDWLNLMPFRQVQRYEVKLVYNDTSLTGPKNSDHCFQMVVVQRSFMLYQFKLETKTSGRC